MNKNTCSIKVFKNCISKVKFLKHLKSHTGLSLLDAKTLTDKIFEKPYKFLKIELLPEVDVEEFRIGLDEMGWIDDLTPNYEFIGDLLWKRNFKLLQLNAATKEEYCDFLLESIIGNIGNTEEILKFALDKLSKEDLMQTVNLYNIN